MYLARPLAAAGALALLALGAACDASAQQIYKIIGPDGRITFSDQTPVEIGKAQPAKVIPLGADGNAATISLPFELRQAAARYPVTIYTSPGCQTCAQGRQLLVTRGVPFTERTIASKEDGEALQRLANTQSVPLLMIGSQQLRGFSDSEWMQFLDAAGYPKTSMLPASYVPPPATPLVALDQQRPADAAAPVPVQAGPSRPAAGPSDPPPANPAGITF
jgi:glutaredoxin